MDWSSLLSALVGGLIALSGQWLQALLSGRAEVRRRGEDAAVKAQALLHEIDVLGRKYGFAGHEGLTNVNEERDVLVGRVRGCSLLIEDRVVRERLLFITGALEDPLGLRDFAGVSESASTWRLVRWGEKVLGAYIRRENQSAEPEFINEYRGALADADAAREEQYKMRLEWQRQERQRPDAGAE